MSVPEAPLRPSGAFSSSLEMASSTTFSISFSHSIRIEPDLIERYSLWMSIYAFVPSDQWASPLDSGNTNCADTLALLGPQNFLTPSVNWKGERHADLWVGTVPRTYSPNSKILSSSQLHSQCWRHISFLSRLNAKIGLRVSSVYIISEREIWHYGR